MVSEHRSTDGIDRTHGRTLIQLRQRDDGSWVATQRGVAVEGTGDTGARAAMEYCQKIAEGD
jgi:hypothetical protein